MSGIITGLQVLVGLSRHQLYQDENMLFTNKQLRAAMALPDSHLRWPYAAKPISATHPQ